MNEREHTAQAVTLALLVFVALLLLVGGCQALSDDDVDDECEFALVAEAKPAPRPARRAVPPAPETVRKAPLLEKKPDAKTPARRGEAPTVKGPAVQKPPSPTGTKTAKPHRGHGLDICDD